MKTFSFWSMAAVMASFAMAQTNPLPVVNLGFSAYNSQIEQLRAQGIRIYSPKATVAQDLEPEYIAVSPDGRTAWVTLQENNALAVIDLVRKEIVRLVPLGYKDHNLPGAGLDPSDKDGAIRIANWPVYGMYQPDAIAAFEVGGQTYLVTANEGDTRGWTAFNEEKRVSALKLDPTAFPDSLKTDAALGRLTVTNQQGDTDGDGDFDRLFVPGTRSFSVWSAQGQLVYDSGDLIEQTVARQYPNHFNAGHTNNTAEDRSDNKGPEPEGLVIGQVGGKPFLFLGLERMSGVMVFDLSNPVQPQLVQYLNNRNFAADVKTAAAGDLGPEGLTFIAASDSPTQNPLLVVANEISGTTTAYAVSPAGQLSVLGSYRVPGDKVFDTGAAEIPAYDPASKRLFVVNGFTRSVDVLNMANPAAITLVTSLKVEGYNPNSVAVHSGLVAIALEDAANKTRPGLVAFFDATGREQARVSVGALPDMLTFSPDGRSVLVANEGEPSDDYSSDPEGSVSLIDVTSLR